MPGLVEAVAGAGARAADEGRRLQAAVEGVGPGVIGAADVAADAARFRHQAPAAVAADVVEHAHATRRVAPQQQRQALSLHGTKVARLRQPGADAAAGPGTVPAPVAISGRDTRR